MATRTRNTTFAGLHCPECGEAEALVIQVEDLTIKCANCDTEITREDVREMIATWRRLLLWLDMAPKAGE